MFYFGAIFDWKQNTNKNTQWAIKQSIIPIIISSRYSIVFMCDIALHFTRNTYELRSCAHSTNPLSQISSKVVPSSHEQLQLTSQRRQDSVWWTWTTSCIHMWKTFSNRVKFELSLHSTVSSRMKPTKHRMKSNKKPKNSVLVILPMTELQPSFAKALSRQAIQIQA